MRALRSSWPLAVMAGGILLVAVAVLAQSGGTFDASWGSIDGGGGTSSGGIYKLSGAIGQPDAGSLAGGQFAVEGGVMGAQYPSSPTATATPTGTPGAEEKSFVPNAAKD